ncbi:MAG: hypothetical protein ACLUNO_09535 [Oscillospiraceae bacterium]
MATRKKTDRAAEAWLSEPVTVRLFRDNGSYKEDKVVTVNGETVRIPRGEDVTIRAASRSCLPRVKRRMRAPAHSSSARPPALPPRAARWGSDHGDASAGAHAHRRHLPERVGRDGKAPVAQRVREHDPDAHPRHGARTVHHLRRGHRPQHQAARARTV